MQKIIPSKKERGVLQKNMTHRSVTVCLPWNNTKHKSISLFGCCIPLVHVASIVGRDQGNLIKLCNDAKIPWAPKPANSSFDLHLSLESIRQLVNRLQWTPQKVMIGMTQLYEAASGTSNKKKEEDEEEEEEKEQEVVVVVPNNRKRPKEQEEEEQQQQGEDDWAVKLIRSVRKSGIAAYWASKEWLEQKDALIQARVDAIEATMMPEICKKLEKEMREAAEKKKKSESIPIKDGVEEEASEYVSRYTKVAFLKE